MIGGARGGYDHGSLRLTNTEMTKEKACENAKAQQMEMPQPSSRASGAKRQVAGNWFALLATTIADNLVNDAMLQVPFFPSDGQAGN